MSVTVIAKLPNGLLAEIGMIVDPATRMPKKGPNYRAVTFNGWNQELAKSFKGQILPIAKPPAGVTEVDDEFWNEWLRIHKDFYFVKKGLITAVPSKPAEVKAAQKDSESQFMGLEPLDPLNVQGDPRTRKAIKPGDIQPVLKDDRT